MHQLVRLSNGSLAVIARKPDDVEASAGEDCVLLPIPSFAGGEYLLDLRLVEVNAFFEHALACGLARLMRSTDVDVDKVIVSAYIDSVPLAKLLFPMPGGG